MLGVVDLVDEMLQLFGNIGKGLVAGQGDLLVVDRLHAALSSCIVMRVGDRPDRALEARCFQALSGLVGRGLTSAIQVP